VIGGEKFNNVKANPVDGKKYETCCNCDIWLPRCKSKVTLNYIK